MTTIPLLPTPAERVKIILAKAHFDIKIAVCWFSHSDIFKCLLDQCQRGIKVTLLLNFDQVNFHAKGLPFDQLAHAGAIIHGYAGTGLLHTKCLLIDRSNLLTGSFNWTQSQHLEHIVEVQSTDTIQQFEQQFEIWQKNCLTWQQMIHSTPKQTHLNQLIRPGIWSATQLRQQVLRGSKTWVAAFNPTTWQTALATFIELEYRIIQRMDFDQSPTATNAVKTILLSGQ
jgi:phosphatidylserine/phosphatidylglycerophosphate/cardiolipin synthase-like enzyme